MNNNNNNKKAKNIPQQKKKSAQKIRKWQLKKGGRTGSKIGQTSHKINLGNNMFFNKLATQEKTNKKSH